MNKPESVTSDSVRERILLLTPMGHRTSLEVILTILEGQRFQLTLIDGQRSVCWEHGWEEIFTSSTDLLSSMLTSTLCYWEKQEAASPRLLRQISAHLRQRAILLSQ